MSLGGLLSVITGDSALRDALDSPGTAGTVPGGDTAVAETGADFTAPPALRPFLAAALTGLPGDEGARQDRRFVLAVTATAR